MQIKSIALSCLLLSSQAHAGSFGLNGGGSYLYGKISTQVLGYETTIKGALSFPVGGIHWVQSIPGGFGWRIYAEYQKYKATVSLTSSTFSYAGGGDTITYNVLGFLEKRFSLFWIGAGGGFAYEPTQALLGSTLAASVGFYPPILSKKIFLETRAQFDVKSASRFQLFPILFQIGYHIY